MTRRVLSRHKCALIIGNNEYENGAKLYCSKNDATDISRTLGRIGFETTLKINLSTRDMDHEINAFVNKIRPNNLVVFFFSGHGMQHQGETYLIPIDNEDMLNNPEFFETNAISVQRTVESMVARAPFCVVCFLDCCRSNVADQFTSERRPFYITHNLRTENSHRMKNECGSLIVYACGLDEKAFDRSPNRRTRLFTFHLLKNITRSNLHVEDMLNDVCAGVRKDSGGELRVHRQSSLDNSTIYLNAVEPDMIEQSVNGEYILIKFCSFSQKYNEKIK
uniref:Caspase-like protein n=1 Tax=Adineta vaga TaxID=104782 RepID=B3G4R7_ADIVA|nr:caspase-like protein [Adineta vaga]